MAQLTFPVTEEDFFSTENITDPYPAYRRLREVGPVVGLGDTGVIAVAHYETVKALLSDNATWVSGQGVALNDFSNNILRGTTLASDPPLHRTLRVVVANQLTPQGLRPREGSILNIAEGIVARALEAGDIDGVPAIAHAMPEQIIPDFVGLPHHGRDRLFEWSNAGLDGLGPDNERTGRNHALSLEQFTYAQGIVESNDVLPGSLGAGVLAAAEEGKISAEQRTALFLDYLGPALDTTSSALGHFLVILAQRPDVWQALKDDPSQVSAFIAEGLRYESPARGFTRVASQDTEVGGVFVPAGTRAWALVASANRDDSYWEDADTFRLERNPTGHVAFGYGIHGCAGQNLAKLELKAVLNEMLSKVATIELTGEPVKLINNMLNAWTSIPLRVTAV